MPPQVDEDGSKEIEFQEFIHAIQINKAMSEKMGNEQDTLDAFVALGGNVSGYCATATNGHFFSFL